MSQPTSSNTSLLIIAVAILAIVAMICGMVVWIMQRTLALNEKYIDMRLAESQGVAQAPAQAKPLTVVPHRVVQPAQSAPANAVAPRVQSGESSQMKERAVTPVVAQAVPPVKATAPIKTRKAPEETPEAKKAVGADGLPLDRVTLPLGKEEFDWQL